MQSRAGLLCAVVIPDGHVALGKLAQALIHGAKVVSIRGSFDDALDVVRELGDRGGVTVVNSINPFRIEGQKTACVRDLRRARHCARRPLHPGRECGQHHGVLARLLRIRP